MGPEENSERARLSRNALKIVCSDTAFHLKRAMRKPARLNFLKHET
jgi:hypothetical protein